MLAVGDLDFRRKCMRHMLGYVERGGSIVLVAHEVSLTTSVCTNCIVLDQGRAVHAGPALEAVDAYLELLSKKKRSDTSSISSASEKAEDSGPSAKITRVSFTAQDGGPPLSDEPVVVEIDIEAPEGLPRALWGFMVVTPDLLVNLAGVMQDSSESRDLPAGTSTLKARIPSLKLLPGVFALRVAVLDSEAMTPYALHGWDQVPTEIAVKALPDRTNHVRALGGVMQSIDAEWN